MQLNDPLESTLTLEEKYLCLDFSNTANLHASDDPVESLHAYSDLVEWGRKEGLLDDQGAASLLSKAQQLPQAAQDTLARAIELREAIFHIFSDMAAGLDPEPKDLETLNCILGKALAQSRLEPQDNKFTWQYTHEPDDLGWFLWPVARSAATLLTSDQLYRVGQCADEHGCGWLFYDTSRNRSRRWCDMGSCGNRAKAQRFYKKSK